MNSTDPYSSLGIPTGCGLAPLMDKDLWRKAGMWTSRVWRYTGVTVNHADVKIRRGQVKYAMLPVWTLHTSWNNQHFLFAMNGQTGKLIGDLPASKGKMTAWGAGVFAVTAAVLGALAHLIGFI